MARHPGVLLDTSMGRFVLELYWDEAPKTCHNFVQLAALGKYDDVVFHRVIKDFMIQGGDPTGTGRGGSSVYGAPFEDEIDSRLCHTGAGVLSMANSGPNTNSSQFFITLAPTPWLDGKHTIFGRVYSGMGIVEHIGSCQTDAGNRPVDPIVIRSATPLDELVRL